MTQGAAEKRMSQEPKREMNEKEIVEFASANLYEVMDSNYYSRCVDGRYSENNPGTIARAGANAGDLEAAFGALNKFEINVPNEVVLESLIQTLGGVENFHFHTDSHSEAAGMGCGHVKHSVTDPTNYGLTLEQGDFIRFSLVELKKQGAKETSLEGEHKESGVIIIESGNYSLKPQDTEGRQAFVYQKTLTEQFLEKFGKILFTKVQEKTPDISEQEFIQELISASDKQLNETVSRLAKGLPVYKVKIGEEKKLEVIKL